ncbi:serum paraoxonase/arylesterase [Rhodotorula diobovata]|uniref:Serum paraoxonase/arylesterase n=1 Tax=Rhodotorula diobovata TaxID=5288 RepID=A0A5C5FQ07_9BASI|nr:serum paraoxonase/arylesterase [Rhodotorula diobovata]
MRFLSLKRYTLGTLALGAALLAVIVNRRVDRLGLYRTVTPLNNDDCFVVPGLEACEDARWVDQESGLAYLACSSQEARMHYVPATLHLNASQLPSVSTDYIALFNINTRSHKRLTLHGLPADAHGIWVHGIDLYRSPSSPSKLTLFLNSHRPPADRSLAPTQGADSVVETFETEVGSDSAQWIKTVRHPLLRTPNSVAAVGERQFYVSNDHRYKVHWTRKWELYKPNPSDIVFCDASGEGNGECKVAADQVIYPNGLATGPHGLLYQASTIEGLMRVWQVQEDHMLVPVEEVQINRHFDNVHVNSATGDIFLTALTKLFDFRAAAKTGGRSGPTPPVEVFRVWEQPGQKKQSKGRRYMSERIFGDPGTTVMGSTAAAPYQDKLLLTGLFSPEVVICKLEQ